MFTGIVTDIGLVTAVVDRSEGGRVMRISSSYPAGRISMGDSVSCAGVCLTVFDLGADSGRSWFEVEMSNETLSLTTLGTYEENSSVNLERALCVGSPLGGHWVTGHVDGMARIVEKFSDGVSWRFRLRPPRELMMYVAGKGSVCLDGVSLTVNEVHEDVFGVNLIPHSLQSTTWGMREIGDAVNFEVDPLARYVARVLEIDDGRKS